MTKLNLRAFQGIFQRVIIKIQGSFFYLKKWKKEKLEKQNSCFFFQGQVELKGGDRFQALIKSVVKSQVFPMNQG